MKKYISRWYSGYLPTLLYMLQVSGYHIPAYLNWIRRTKDFGQVRKRQRLIYTPKVVLLYTAGVVLIAVVCVSTAIAILAATTSTRMDVLLWWTIAGVIVFCAPFIVAYGLAIPLVIGYYCFQRPQERRLIAAASKKRQNISATVIAIAGSYGKTTFKETLQTVLAQGKTVRSTPGNMNTPIGISRFLLSLDGNEECIICELGESHEGDIATLCQLVQPDIGVITGINEAHLETFGTIDVTIRTIFELEDFLGSKPLYVNADNVHIRKRNATPGKLAYTTRGVDGWHVEKAQVTLDGTRFVAKNGTTKIPINSKLIGEHQIGTLVACVDIATRLGLSVSDITRGIEKTSAYEHRMQPYSLGGAIIIDDTYNGNIDGMLAGLALLKKHTSAGRRIYVTPGLVEQGMETEAIHHRLGTAIAESCDEVILINNSVTQYIQDGLQEAGFSGSVRIVEDPLPFYTNLAQIVAEGDIVLMQNDWTDNYS
jgi:UDP-N-acetylmuramoyl-tripeptide--D-alanyl-D-alanine ligase